MSRAPRPAAALLLALALLPGAAAAQQIALDRGVRAAGLWCFPLTTDPRVYVYIPAEARLATDAAGLPQFSFVRYVINRPSAGEGAETITEAAGGGILHFLVLLDTPAATVEAAQQALRRGLRDDEILLRGPLVFAEGRYALVSSILNPSSRAAERSLLASGRAPVLEGNRLAFSFDLEPQQASLLLESFKMATPDVSLVFDLTFAGLSDAYDAELFIDWSEVRQSQGFSAGASVYFVSADVEVMFDELRRTNAIRLRTSGTDAAMEALLTNVYDKLLELMFRKVDPESVPAEQRGGLTDALAALAGSGGPLSARRTTGFGAAVGYQLKDLRSGGTSTLDFHHRANLERHAFVTFNIGDFYRRFGDDPRIFHPVNLEDPTYQQREIVVGVDGALVADFPSYINSVTVTLRKQHQNGQQTLRELVIDPAAAVQEPGRLRMVYGWNGDLDRLAWLQYETRTRWSFKGGGTYQTDWAASDAPMVELFAPFERRSVALSGSAETLRAQGVRAVVVRIEYPFFEGRRRQQVLVRPEQMTTEPTLEITLPLGSYAYDYAITWQLEGGRQLNATGSDASGVLFIDELPAAPAAGGGMAAAARGARKEMAR